MRGGEQISGCQILETVGGRRMGVSIKGQHKGGVCGHETVLYCGSYSVWGGHW